MASFWSNNVATKRDIGSFGFEPGDDDDDDGCERYGAGDSGWSFVIIDDCNGTVVKVVDGGACCGGGGGGGGGVDDDDAVAEAEPVVVAVGRPFVFAAWFALLLFRGWY